MTKKSTESIEHLARPSRSEWELLGIILRLGRPSIPQILQEALRLDRVLDYHSSHTLLTRLVAKGYLEVVKGRGRFVHYVLCVDPGAVLRLEVERFLDEVAGDDGSGLEVVGEIVAQRIRALGGE